MTSYSYRPNAPLNQYVDLIWVGKASNLQLEARHHAAMFTELIFNYGDTFQVEGQNIVNYIGTDNHQIISGLKTEPFQTKVSGVYGSVGLILKPFCYGMLIDQFGSKAMEQISEILYNHLFAINEPNYQLVEKKLLSLFGNKAIDNDLMKFENYLSSKVLGKGSLSDFNLSISISQKSFIQKFKKNYQLTPGEYVKLKQVNHAIHLLQNNNAEKLIQVGLDAGFYDQSHFIRVFKKFCGLSPKQFVKSLKKE